ncbi:hypothetical protein ABK040_007199 [Willaertia magna]
MSHYSQGHNQTVYMLVKYVMRAFYETEHIIVVDALLDYQSHQIDEVREADLAKKVNLQLKTIKKALNELRSDFLVVSEPKPVERKKGQKKFSKDEMYWKIDYKQFINAVRYKLYRISEEVKTKEKEEMKFVCKGCHEEYSCFDANKLYDFMTDKFICTICGCEVDESSESNDKHNDTISGKETLETKFQKQLEPINSRIKECEDYVVPLEQRWNYKAIVTREQAKKREQEQLTAIEREKKLGSHSKNYVRSSSGGTSLGAVAHVSKSGAGNASGIQLDSNATIKIDLAGHEGLNEEEEEKAEVLVPSQKKPENPFFLKQTVSSKEYADYNENDEMNDDEDHIRDNDEKQLNSSLYHQLLEEYNEPVKKDEEFDDLDNVPMQQQEQEQPIESTEQMVEDQQQMMMVEQQQTEQPPENQILVYVNGQPIPYDQVNDDHMAEMTSDEYSYYLQLKEQQEEYFEI